MTSTNACRLSEETKAIHTAFAKFIVKLLRFCTIRHVSHLTGVGWDTIKEIHSEWLKKHYSPPRLKGVRNIGIDEFSTRRGHKYMTIVIDLDTRRIIYAHRGRDKEALRVFWNRVHRQGIKIEHITTDMSHAYIASIMENAPDAIHIFDHFHVVKLMNDALNDIRQQQYRMERSINRRNVLKGTMYLLLRNGEDIMDKRHKSRLDNALAMNEPLSKAYYLKEALREIWNQHDKNTAAKALNDWCEQAEKSKIRQLMKMASTVRMWRRGILAWYDYRISNAIIEGTNNKIKVLKRTAYGYRDEKYFKLRLYALHDQSITQNVG